MRQTVLAVGGASVKVMVALLVAWVIQLTWAQAPDRISHDVSVSVPSYFGIRIVNNANLPIGSPAVTFDYSAQVATYTSAVAGSGYLEPTSVSDFADVQVSVRTGFGIPLWYVEVKASPLLYKGDAQGAGLALSDLSVVRGARSKLNPQAVAWGNARASWTLSGSPQWIAYSLLGTQGWQTLGFNGFDYRLRVDGNEDFGEFSTTVTYTILYP